MAQKPATHVVGSLAMPDLKEKTSRIARGNRFGCFLIIGLLLMLIAILAYVGFSSEPIDSLKSSIPAFG